jgi:hypothetical protein
MDEYQARTSNEEGHSGTKVCTKCTRVMHMCIICVPGVRAWSLRGATSIPDPNPGPDADPDADPESHADADADPSLDPDPDPDPN